MRHRNKGNMFCPKHCRFFILLPKETFGFELGIVTQVVIFMIFCEPVRLPSYYDIRQNTVRDRPLNKILEALEPRDNP